ncbi:hypothetical protein RB653_009729 [Dictyostelium firmibasis]|uniref:Uncharacterized protein n=1 Tax=Dictyostelium firmibasis TaxID=79012 RepID=A0AAN7YT58_9MYCE
MEIKPAKILIYYTSDDQKKVVEEMIEKFLDLGIITRSKSNCSSPIIRDEIIKKEEKLKWDEEIKNIEFAINSSTNTSTQRSPMNIVFGFEPRMPININTRYNIQFTEATNYFTQVARDNMVDAQINQAIQCNKIREDIEYEEGDWVLIKITHY